MKRDEDLPFFLSSPFAEEIFQLTHSKQKNRRQIWPVISPNLLNWIERKKARRDPGGLSCFRVKPSQKCEAQGKKAEAQGKKAEAQGKKAKAQG